MDKIKYVHMCGPMLHIIPLSLTSLTSLSLLSQSKSKFKEKTDADPPSLSMTIQLP